MVLLLSDEDIGQTAPADAVGWMVEALRCRAQGRLASPPRTSAALPSGKVVLTAGQGPEWYGYRVYDTASTTEGQQVVVAHDNVTGNVAAIHVGNRLGAMRTGALGGAAAQALGPVGPARVAVIGAGAQAWSQVWALSGVIDISEVSVTSRSAASRERLARQASDLGLTARAVGSAREAVAGADIVVLATNSSEPVLDTSWLKDDVFVTTLGPKQVGRAEFALSLLDGADVVVTDSPDQLRAYDPPSLVADAGMAPDVRDLADLVSADAGPAIPRTGRRVYLSVGLAGTEVHLLGRLSQRLNGTARG